MTGCSVVTVVTLMVLSGYSGYSNGWVLVETNGWLLQGEAVPSGGPPAVGLGVLVRWIPHR